jgi:hypothetical protein
VECQHGDAEDHCRQRLIDEHQPLTWLIDSAFVAGTMSFYGFAEFERNSGD